VARLRRRSAQLACGVAAALLLAACGGGPNAYAVTACKGITRALADYHRSLHARSPSAATSYLDAAQHQINLIMHDAAMANSQDGSYDALMTLVQQAQELPFGNVAGALADTCRAVNSPTGYL
jgi:hypothetical protein